MLMNEVTIFRPNSRKKEATISGPVSAQVIDLLGERMGAQTAAQARKAFRALKSTGGDLLQFKEGNRRIRVRQIEA
jgi:hypothetical protein